MVFEGEGDLGHPRRVKGDRRRGSAQGIPRDNGGQWSVVVSCGCPGEKQVVIKGGSVTLGLLIPAPPHTNLLL